MIREAAAGAATGYLHADYAASLADVGRPICLPRSGGWMLERSIPKSDRWDAMGCYPLFSCADWRALPDDLEALQHDEDVVSLVAVIDPLADVSQPLLQRAFADLHRPFKEHFIVEVDQPRESFVNSHHQRNARKALQQVSVEISTQPAAWASEWLDLYGALIRHHAITGISAFSERALAAQLEVPGAVALRARRGAASLAMLVWYEQDGAAYYHLGASDPEGYAVGASFALFWEALAFFRERGLKLLELGGGAGATTREDDGLSRFKRGWATTTRTSYLCGRIFDHTAYAELAARHPGANERYFPAYRAGEFA